MNCLGYSSKTAWKSLKQVLQQGKSEAGDPGRTLSKRRISANWEHTVREVEIYFPKIFKNVGARRFFF